MKKLLILSSVVFLFGCNNDVGRYQYSQDDIIDTKTGKVYHAKYVGDEDKQYQFYFMGAICDSTEEFASKIRKEKK